MSQLLTVDEPVQAEMRSTTLLLGGSQFPQFSRRLSELLAESGQHVVEGAIPASVNLRKGLTAASLRVIWILDACSAMEWQPLRAVMQQAAGHRVSLCVLLAGGAFRPPNPHWETELRELQAETRGVGIRDILLLGCGVLTVDDAHVPEQLQIPRWLAPLLPRSATLPCLSAVRLAQVLTAEFTGESSLPVAGLRRLTIPGRRYSLRQLLQRGRGRAAGSVLAAAIASIAAYCGAGVLVSLLLGVMVRQGRGWTSLLVQTVRPRSSGELLELYNRWSWPDVQLAGWNNGVVHFGWKFPGRTVVSTSASGRCLRVGRETVTVDGGVPLKRVLLALQAVGRSLPVVPNFSWISMGTAFFVPVHGSGSRMSTLGQAVVRVLVYDAAVGCLRRLHRDDPEFQRMMYDRSRPLLLLRMTLQTQQPLKYAVREESLRDPVADELLLAFADPRAANVEVRKARAIDREVIVRRFDAEPADAGGGELPRDRLGSLWDRIEETPVAGWLFHWFVRSFAFHVELLMSPEQFRVFWEHHRRLPLAKIQLRRMLRDGIENSACRDCDCICADLFMLRGKRHVFTKFIAEHLPAVRTNPGKQSL